MKRLTLAAMLALLSCSRDPMTCTEAGGHEELARFQPMLNPGPILVPITTCEIR